MYKNYVDPVNHKMSIVASFHTEYFLTLSLLSCHLSTQGLMYKKLDDSVLTMKHWRLGCHDGWLKEGSDRSFTRADSHHGHLYLIKCIVHSKIT